MHNTITKYHFSGAITWLRFPLIFLVIMLHCYSVQRIPGNHETYFRVIYPFYIWLGETGVPGFFFISGFLFFYSKKSYIQKLNTRVHTLLIPYILWNTFLLLLYVIAYVLGFPQDINGKNITEFNIIDYIRLFWDRGSYDDGNFVPLLCPLWYIRNLLIMSIISPLLLLFIKFMRVVFLIFIAFWWMLTYNNAFIPQTIFFFSLGAYFSIFEINPLKIVLEKRTFFIIAFALLGFTDVYTHAVEGTPINLQIHRLSLIFNIPALLMLADYCMRHGFHHQLLANAAFIVFCVHYPIVVILRKLCISTFIEADDWTHIILYFICVIVSTLLSLALYCILDKFFPKFKQLLSGNR